MLFTEHLRQQATCFDGKVCVVIILIDFYAVEYANWTNYFSKIY